MLTLFIARHGNTFDSGDIPLRVGKGTDLSLSKSGQEQAKQLGLFLNKTNAKMDEVYVSSLKRTQETAHIALPHFPYIVDSIFDEVDYGIDEGQPESSVVHRIGKEALKQWDEEGVVPQGWNINTEKIIQNWKQFSINCIKKYPLGGMVLVVTSNGIARFAPYILNVYEKQVKMRTGAISALSYIENQWKILFWDVRPNDN